MKQEAYPGSWWSVSAQHPRDFPPLEGEVDTEVAIIGGGFTGLSAAHHLQSMGKSCVVLEAQGIGWGASGRNGGIAVPRYKLTYPELEKKYGEPTALAMYRTAHDAVDALEQVVATHGLACGFARTGHLTPVVSAIDEARFAADVEWLAAKLGDRQPRMLDRAQAARKTGTPFYSAAYHEPRGAAIHPLDYCLALANALVTHGVAIHVATPVTRWQSSGSEVRLETPHGTVKAKHLLIATNAYSDFTAAGQRVERRVVPVASAVIATEPLPPALRASILPDGEPATDAKRLTNYFRVLPDGSFFFGGRGGASSRASQRIYDRLRRDLLAIYPQLANVAVRHQWFGLVAVTLDSLPHIGSLESNVHFAMGYNGRGVALSALFGQQLARLAAGEPPQLGPMSQAPFQPIPFHALRVPAKQVALSWKQFVDALGV